MNHVPGLWMLIFGYILSMVTSSVALIICYSVVPWKKMLPKSSCSTQRWLLEIRIAGLYILLWATLLLSFASCLILFLGWLSNATTNCGIIR